ncbi:hypothetical protein MVEN_01948400 [Mycena venus]|uniref:Uncharacterized protein n=1 Tax=Mycena venus TaxID=2733690 RepID=A0A8H6XF47_9AGAR|nr:hypothetical protein MVEN_01948400 [Mycena venus]
MGILNLISQRRTSSQYCTTLQDPRNMPSAVHTVDVNSPLIKYEGPWTRGGDDGDPERGLYNQGTFVYCAGTQCSATLSFTGTEIHVVGAYRNNSCPYQVDLDGQIFGPFSTAPIKVEQFQIDLFNRTDLVPGPHSLTISNLPATASGQMNLNLDYFTWTSDVNSLTDVRIQDDAQAFVYDPPSAWNAFTNNFPGLPGFDQGTGHATVQYNATATLTFTGDRVALYGAIGAQGGPYSVHIDNGSVASTFTTYQMISDPNTPLPNYLAGQLLFYADSLPPGDHTVTLTSNLASTTQDLTIDYAIVDGSLNSVPTSGSSTSSTASTSSSSMMATFVVPRSESALSPARLGGIITGVTVLALFLLGSLVYILRLRRRLRNGGVSSENENTISVARPFVQHQTQPTPMSPSSPFSVTPFLATARPSWQTEKRLRTEAQLGPPQYDFIETS